MSSRRKRLELILAILLFGVLLVFVLFRIPQLDPYIRIAVAKVRGDADRCSITSSLMPSTEFLLKVEELRANSRVLKQVGALFQIRTPSGDFWAPQGTDLAYVLAEQQFRVYGDGENRVRDDEIVLDCGANVGAFTREALNAGAKLVVAIEPVPDNVQCLEWTFAPEIAAGRVVIVPKGVWHQNDRLRMTLFANSVLDSFVMHGRKEESQSNLTEVLLPLVPLDDIVASLCLPRVDFIKMDIEGAERNALRGATKTIRQWKPRLSIATENLPDDSVVLHDIILGIAPEYQITCGPCELKGRYTVRPLVLYFSPKST